MTPAETRRAQAARELWAPSAPCCGTAAALKALPAGGSGAQDLYSFAVDFDLYPRLFVLATIETERERYVYVIYICTYI